MSEITMPQLGESVTEGTITKWFKQVGDSVAEDEPLFEVSTDKVDSEVPSPAAGVIAEIRVPEGETVDVGTVLVVLAGAGDATASPPAPNAAAPAEPAVAARVAPGMTFAPPAASIAAPPVASAAPAADAAASLAGSRRLLSPLVRRLIEQNGLDASSITGTGLGGRITREDVLSVLDTRAGGGAPVPPPAAAPPAAPAAPAAPVAPAAAAPAAPAPPVSPVTPVSTPQEPAEAEIVSQAAAPPAPAAAGPSQEIVTRPASVATRGGVGDTIEPLNNIRRRTGEHMVMSKSVSPHAITMVEVDFEAVERARKPLRAQFKDEEGFSLTYLPFVSRAVIDALSEFPHMNATVGEGELIVHHYVNLSIAVDLEYQGLLAPVVKDADGKRLRAIARDINDLASRARSKQLSPDELSGGTFTLSNSGSFGTFMVVPIINQPQTGILSTDGVKRRPVVVALPDGSESIAIHSVGNLTLSWDHRAFDGAYAAAFMARVKEILETRDWASEL